MSAAIITRALLLDDTGNYHHVAPITFNAMQVLPIAVEHHRRRGVNNVFDRNPPAVLSAVTNSLDSASAFPAVKVARNTPSVLTDGHMTQLERCVSVAKPPRSCHGRQATRILQCNTQSPASTGIHRHLHGTPQR
ncbi:hypothetical protein FHY30_001598 [Xanthomonas arboricola]|uniref:hypothetical protein n=1 Tax=Xanthomonas campestris TaxID=339 RepID=UPI0023E9AA4D|nr:hypothetical protein [Xanthomonas campestris]